MKTEELDKTSNDMIFIRQDKRVRLRKGVGRRKLERYGAIETEEQSTYWMRQCLPSATRRRSTKGRPGRRCGRLPAANNKPTE